MNHTIKVLLAAVLLTGVASAEPAETAEAALKRGQTALKAGRIHEACTAFEASHAIDAKLETELSLAGCYAQDGKPVAAARLYRSVAEKDTNAARRQSSIAKAAKLEANAPKLRFAISQRPPGLVIKVDGVEVPTTGDVLVDQGPHEVVATAPGFQGRASAPVDRDRVVIDVIIRMEPVEEAAPAKPMIAAPSPKVAPPTAERMTATEMPAPASRKSHRKRNGIILAASGLAVLVAGGIVFERSTDKFDEEHALCPQSKCANEMDLEKAFSLLDEGRQLRGVSIGMGIGSGLLIAAGTYLLLTPTKEQPRVSLQVQPGGASIGYATSF